MIWTFLTDWPTSNFWSNKRVRKHALWGLTPADFSFVPGVAYRASPCIRPFRENSAMTIDPRDFGRLEGKLDAIQAQLVPLVADLEKRMRAQGRRSRIVAGLTVVLGPLFGISTAKFPQ